MCLIVKRGTKSIVTEEEMTVYKIVRPAAYDGRVFSMYRDFTYHDGVTLECCIERTPLYDATFLDYVDIQNVKQLLGFEEEATIEDVLGSGKVDAYGRGFHFFETMDDALAHDGGNIRVTIAKFVIPKDSEIILSGTGLGITNAIRYVSEFK